MWFMGGYVYIVTNKNKTTIYIGVTSNLPERIRQYKNHAFRGSFTDKYNLEYCIYYEYFDKIEDAFERETQLKKWNREKKNNLINQRNPDWKDLYNQIKRL